MYEFFHDYPKGDKAPPYTELNMFMYRVIFFPIVLMLCVAVNIYIWKAARINYSFIFQFNPRTQLSPKQYLEAALILFNLLLLSIVLFLWFEGAEERNEIPNLNIGWVHPVILYGVIILILIFPFKIFYRASRFWLLRVLFRIAIAPLKKVEFRDFWLADQLTSMGEFLFEAQFLFCIYPTMQNPERNNIV